MFCSMLLRGRLTMDQYIAEIVICIITGTFTILSLVLQKKQDKIVEKIDKKTMFIEKEKLLQQKLVDLSKERESIIHSMICLIMGINLDVVQAIEIAGVLKLDYETNDVYELAADLKRRFEKTNQEIAEITREYELVTEMAIEAQKELEKIQKEN